MRLHLVLLMNLINRRSSKTVSKHSIKPSQDDILLFFLSLLSFYLLVEGIVEQGSSDWLGVNRSLSERKRWFADIFLNINFIIRVHEQKPYPQLHIMDIIFVTRRLAILH